MMAIFLLIALIALIIASYTDFKTREVPDWLNFALIFTGVAVHGILSITAWNYWPVVSSLIGLGIGVGISFAMYYLGQWGGGDAKMLMGLGAIIGFDLNEMFFLSFIVNVFFIGAFYGIFYGVILAIKNRKKFAETFRTLNSKTSLNLRRALKISSVIVVVLGFVFLIVFKDLILFSFVVLVALLLLLYYLYIFAKSIEKCCMLSYKPPEKLTEGDWIAKNVFYKGKYICGPKDLGILKKQIALLKRFKISKVLVKDGIPFVPSFLISFVVTYFFGNILFSIL